ncbi:MAG: hypothetical protein IJ679_02780 [Lachnospiraceae bacterium]|nr:hypothetical protein [Lachnospiraceae bacterium]
MIHIDISYDMKQVPITALYVSKIAEGYGLSPKRASMPCFVLEAIMETRMKQVHRDDPILRLDIEERKAKLMIRVTDKGLPYVLAEKERHILESGAVDRFLFEQLGADGQRLSLFYKLPSDYTAPEG